MRVLKTALVMAFAVVALAFAACDSDGAFEEIGEEVDQAGDEVEEEF